MGPPPKAVTPTASKEKTPPSRMKPSMSSPEARIHCTLRLWVKKSVPQRNLLKQSKRRTQEEQVATLKLQKLQASHLWPQSFSERELLSIPSKIGHSFECC